MPEALACGLSKRVITPPPGTVMAGYLDREGPALGKHDDLYARALFLKKNDTKTLLISLDILGIDGELRNFLVEKINEATGIDPTRIVITATHNHSGPDVFGTYSERNESLLERLAKEVAEVAVNSYKAEIPIENLSYAVSSCQEVLMNRRKPEGGPIDPRIHTLQLLGPINLQ